ncbi:glycosyltransferase [Candidatus Woesebacteria bacterium]|nr:MAG: glycosyltransferase [Candidatus Woesebacteria bacterium]
MKKSTKTLVSIVVPSYKEGKTIKTDLEILIKTLKQGLPEKYDFEIICVEDGQFDNTSAEVKKLHYSNLKFISYKENRGKGYAVRTGMKEANGDLISFMDAGRDIKEKGIMMLLAHMEWYDADVIVGSKRHPASKLDYPLLRRILSVGYSFGIKLLFGLSLTDTQSGIKIFKKEVIKKILPKLSIDRFAMDIEMLALANHMGYTRIYEAPIELNFNVGKSRIQFFPIFNPNSPFKMAWDTLAVYNKLKILHYYDKK